ncbi:PadR family transcriptional regulator [Kocuria palustris]|uniref:PadR family transcriptional regulator n=1 Tax=Kocuria palustris TaxID=71999 RepID=UPI0006AA49C9|nr:PadR family transcriptional regulator [Kocuria palustris]ALB03196.1 hypothetical protein KPaMU14_06265 [Kocuria palustris]
MSLRSALLALMAAGPLTGYDAAKHFSGSVGNVWRASDSQIYPQLRRMERDGVLSTRKAPWGPNGATKTEYLITDAGREELRAWADQPVDYPPIRDPASLRTAYLEWAEPEAVLRHFQDHIEHFRGVQGQAQDQLDQIGSGQHPTLLRRTSALGDRERERTVRFKQFAYEGIIARAQAEVEWAQDCLRELEGRAD